MIAALGVGIEPTASDDEAAADAAGEEITEYVLDLIAKRRRRPPRRPVERHDPSQRR